MTPGTYKIASSEKKWKLKNDFGIFKLFMYKVTSIGQRTASAVLASYKELINNY